jgi:N-acetylmuramoyl-L-alanine amidase
MPLRNASIQAKAIAKMHLKNSMNKIIFSFFSLALFFISSCANNPQAAQDTPSWYISPKQNNSENLYGTAQGYSLEEATKYALADAASRLMVSISSESKLTREENQNSVNEEMRQNVRQNVEKISFTNFKVTKSTKLGQNFFVEVQIERGPFINQQKERADSLQKQISDLDKNSNGKNPIQRRNSLIKIIDLGKELELKGRIISGAGENFDLKSTLTKLANFNSQLDKISDKIEFYFEINSSKEIAQIIRNALNKEKIKISPSHNKADSGQVVIKIKSSHKTNQIYGAFITKLEVDFENLADEKILASNSLEVTGSSSISEKESYFASLKSLEEKIASDGILKVMGIVN